ncbi:MAG: glycosyltransferase [Cyanobacteria bacterium P01_B01_bin.77]
MITVTLGTIAYPFQRALSWVEELILQEVITEPLFVQYGASNICQLASHSLVTAVPFVELSDLQTQIEASRLVISHAGQGSTRMLADMGVAFVLVPRLAQYNEHIDDHQLLFAKSVEPVGVSHCLTLDALQNFVVHPPKKVQKRLFDSPHLAEHLIHAYP